MINVSDNIGKLQHVEDITAYADGIDYVAVSNLYILNKELK
jgi:hypothetical protein